jgi:2-polyprenyl-6-methoxyphenol hydroxylase-like FAD-dependent oxidoreductase
MVNAVVVGAGIAGLCAARTLADRCTRVVVLDRDSLPDKAVPRAGVPQSGQGHILLIAGQRALEELFPGLTDELAAAGATRFDPGLDMAFSRWGLVWPRVETGLMLVTFSRPLLELAIRRRVRALPGVEVRAGVAVTGLSISNDRVDGVLLDNGERLDADLVVDCTGRANRSSRWLSAHGFPAPDTTEVTVGAGYATRFYRRKPGDLPDATAVFALPGPPDEKRGGLVLPVEDDRWLISLFGWHGQFPRDEESFTRHAEALPQPAIAALVESCEPLTEVDMCQFPAGRRRHFERLDRVPAGFLALGDAVCSFNPIYGQGMTCAALEALALGELLDANGGAVDSALPSAFYRRAGAIVATPWQFATGGDFAYPETRGPRPRGIGLFNAYAKRIQLASTVDGDIRRAFNAVQHLVLDPAVLRKPAMVVKVLRTARRAGR